MIDLQHVHALAAALRAGAVLPPIVAEQKTKRIVDGFNRTKAYLSLYGADAEVSVEWRKYKNEQDLFLDAVRLNSGHGKRLTPFDMAHCYQLGQGLSVNPDILASALSITADKFAQITTRKTAIGADGKFLPIRRSLSHLSGTQLTLKQEEGAKLMGGQSLIFLVNQLVTAFECNLIPAHNNTLQRHLEKLYGLLAAYCESSQQQKKSA